MSNENQGMDAAQVKALIEQEKQARVERCKAAIDQALREERCVLDVSVVVTARGNIPQLSIVALT